MSSEIRKLSSASIRNAILISLALNGLVYLATRFSVRLLHDTYASYILVSLWIPSGSLTSLITDSDLLTFLFQVLLFSLIIWYFMEKRRTNPSEQIMESEQSKADVIKKGEDIKSKLVFRSRTMFASSDYLIMILKAVSYPFLTYVTIYIGSLEAFLYKGDIAVGYLLWFFCLPWLSLSLIWDCKSETSGSVKTMKLGILLIVHVVYLSLAYPLGIHAFQVLGLQDWPREDIFFMLLSFPLSLLYYYKSVL